MKMLEKNLKREQNYQYKKQTMIHKFKDRSYLLNWSPSRGDHRDFIYKPTTGDLAPKIDMSDVYKKVFDQGNLGSCTANAGSGFHGFERAKAGLDGYHASRLFLYYNERAREGNVNYDSGAYVRDVINVFYNLGACRESDWGYGHDFRQRPTDECYQQALPYKIGGYSKIDNSNIINIKSALSNGHSVIFGFTCYESLESAETARTGIIPLPQRGERTIGGHCVWLHGYDDSKDLFAGRNSWGEDWGQGGNFQIPYAYLTNTNIASDFWIITSLK